MAYQYTTGIAQNTADFCKKLYTFAVTTTGWTTIQDSSFSTGGANSVNTYLTISSTGESGNDSNVIQFQRGNANFLNTLGMLSYTTGGPPGTRRAMAGSLSTTFGTGTGVTADDEGAFYYWLFGSLDRFIIFTATPSRIGVMDAAYVGSYTRTRSTNVATCSNTPAAGTSVLFNTANTAFFTVGKRYTIADASNFESPKVTAINAGVSVTLDVLNNSYVSGARLGEDPRPLLVTVGSSTMGWTSSNWLVAPPLRQTLASPTGSTTGTAAGEFVVDSISSTMLERSADYAGQDGGPDGGGGSINGLTNMWPLYVYDGSTFGGGIMGTMTEVYLVSSNAGVTDDTFSASGNTYHYINTASGITAVAGGISGAAAFAVRRA